MRALLVFLTLLCSVASAAQQNDDALWAALQKGGHVILIRHAVTTPGVGDPPGFQVDDCKTQRNLSEQGRADAKRLGEVLKQRKVPIGEVKSSLWCRCIDTAMLAFGRVDAWSALNNFFETPHLEGAATEAVRTRLATLKPDKTNIVLVTHGVNVAALSGLSPGTAEMVILKPNGTKTPPVVGRLYAK
jgi:broad specificity phosphatase PhoE